MNVRTNGRRYGLTEVPILYTTSRKQRVHTELCLTNNASVCADTEKTKRVDNETKREAILPAHTTTAT